MIPLTKAQKERIYIKQNVTAFPRPLHVCARLRGRRNIRVPGVINVKRRGV